MYNTTLYILYHRSIYLSIDTASQQTPSLFKANRWAMGYKRSSRHLIQVPAQTFRKIPPPTPPGCCKRRKMTSIIRSKMYCELSFFEILRIGDDKDRRSAGLLLVGTWKYKLKYTFASQVLRIVEGRRGLSTVGYIQVEMEKQRWDLVKCRRRRRRSAFPVGVTNYYSEQHWNAWLDRVLIFLERKHVAK